MDYNTYNTKFPLVLEEVDDKKETKEKDSDTTDETKPKFPKTSKIDVDPQAIGV